MGKFDKERYEKGREVAVTFFDKNETINSACLGEIKINSEGFTHLVWKNPNKKHKRDWKDQIKRFQLLKYIKPIIEGMSHYQEYSEGCEDVNCKMQHKPVIISKFVKYYSFIAVINNEIRIKIILRKVGNGSIHFWSIIPAWKIEKYRDIKILNIQNGNPKED